MEHLRYLIWYGVISLSLAWTSYITIFRPSIELLKEIIEEEKTVYSGFVGFILWTIFAAILAPFTAYVLLKNRNEEFIQEFAVSLADRHMEDDE